MEATVFVPVGLGLTVIGAGLGIGRFAASAAESIAVSYTHLRAHET